MEVKPDKITRIAEEIVNFMKRHKLTHFEADMVLQNCKFILKDTKIS